MGKKDKKDRSLAAWAEVILGATLICEECGEVHRIKNLTEKWYDCKTCGHKMRGREKGDRDKYVPTVDEVTPPQEPPDYPARTERPVERKAGATKIAYGYYVDHKQKIFEGKITRAMAIEAVVALGVQKGTASVQWSRFVRENIQDGN